MNYNHANIGITEGGKQSLFICQKDVVPYTISGVRKGGRVFFYLPERCKLQLDANMEAQKGEEYFPMCRKDVNSDLMPIWKHVRGEENFSMCRKDAKVGFCASDGP